MQEVDQEIVSYHPSDQDLFIGGKGIRTPDPLHAISHGRFLERPSLSNCAIDIVAGFHTRVPEPADRFWRCLHGCLHREIGAPWVKSAPT